MNDLLIERYVKHLEDYKKNYTFIGYHFVPNEIRDNLSGPITMKHQKYFGHILYLIEKYKFIFGIQYRELKNLPYIDTIRYLNEINIDKKQSDNLLEFFNEFGFNITFFEKYQKHSKDYESQLVFKKNYGSIVYDEVGRYEWKPSIYECDNNRFIIYTTADIVLTDTIGVNYEQ